MNSTNIEYAHLVLVEDDTALAELTAEYLSQQGYKITTIDNGLEAVATIPELNADCVILDVMLPGLDGIEACRQLRSHYHGPIIFLTARGDSVDEILGLEVGGDDYLSKPVEPRLLLAHIRAHLRSNQRQHQPFDVRAEPANSVQIDEKRNTIFIGDEELKISQPEYLLMKLFLQQQDSIVSRDDIMMCIRGIEHDGLSRTVDILISDLRKKLPDPEWIKTIRGRGYLWQGN